MSTKAKLALCQMAVTSVKKENLAKAASVVAKARADFKADVVILPECFNCPYGTKFFPDYAEPVPEIGATFDLIQSNAATFQSASVLSKAASDNKVWLVGGSIPECTGSEEKGDRKLYNTSLVFSPEGTLLAKHRKIHLFKINTETVKMDEGEVLTAGDTPTVFEAKKSEEHSTLPDNFKIGVGICFDIRYPQLATYYHQQNTSLLVYPGAFNMVTGPIHWIFAARCRAVDCQQFVAVCSPARDTSAGYIAYGHSAVVDPWGEVLVEAGEGEEIVATDIDFEKLASIRGRLPINAGTRNDLYKLDWKQ